jgi:type II secretory pathway pseudopilin PulG
MRPSRLRDEAGTTLLELMFGMSVMAIFLGIFSTGIVMLTRTSIHTEAVVDTSSDLNSAFLRLDKEVRYAASISSPGISGTSGYWYVEFMTSNTGSSVCTQLRIDTAGEQLEQRTWTLPGTGFTDLSKWLPIASDITNGTAVASSVDPPVPFTLIASGGNLNQERLRIDLVATSGNPQTSSRSTVTFTAVNSQSASQAASNSATYPSSVCTEAGRP